MKETVIKCLKVLGFMILSEALMLLGDIIGELCAYPLNHANSAALQFSGKYFTFIGIWIVVIAYCLIVKKNRKYFPILGKGGKGNNAKTILLLGLPLGLGLNLLVALVAMAHGDIHLYFAEFNLPLILLFIVTVAVQCGAEELVCRWFLYQKVKDLFPKYPLVPILVSAFYFSIGHGMNPGVTVLSLVNIFLIGILYAMVIYYYDCFWACVLAHTGWNFCQSILLGLPNSGLVSSYSMFKLDAANAMNSFTYNTGFGIEGTVMSSVVVAISCVIVFYLGRKKKVKEKIAA